MQSHGGRQQAGAGAECPGCGVSAGADRRAPGACGRESGRDASVGAADLGAERARAREGVVATSWFFNGSGAANARVGCTRCTGGRDLLQKTSVSGHGFGPHKTSHWPRLWRERLLGNTRAAGCGVAPEKN